jgi:hypothetical protein
VVWRKPVIVDGACHARRWCKDGAR